MLPEPVFPRDNGAERRVHRPEARVAGLAARQHGVVGRWQLAELGLSRGEIGGMLRRGSLQRIHRGVYAVGHRNLSRFGWWTAAAISGGPGSVLSHRPAGAAWGLREWSGRHTITTPTWRRAHGGIEVHCSKLPQDERSILDGIPITSVSRTLLDLATLLQPHELLNAVNEAEIRELADPLSLPGLLERHHGERGTALLRSVLSEAGYGVTMRELEARFAEFIRERRLPAPELNAWITVGGTSYSPDCMWRSERVIVELHSARYHSTVPAVTRDATRDRRLLLAGWRVIHVTWAQMKNAREADELERDLRTALRP